MDTRTIKQRIQETTTRIENIIRDTEDIYGSIHAQLPSIEREIELTLEEMSILLECFVPSKEPGQHITEEAEAHALSTVLKQVQDNFTATRDELVGEKEIRDTIDLFLEEDGEENAGVSSLLVMIEQIKGRLTDIEVVSLNAVIFSAHLGERGRAFGVISDNINSLSYQINQQYAGIQEEARALSRWNEQFREDLKSLLQQHGNISTGQQEEFQELFQTTFHSLQEISRLLEDLISNVKKVIMPVQNLMVSIQMQDIIRQNMENLSRCLGTVAEHADAYGRPDTSLEDSLNFLSFAQKVLKLTGELVSNVENQLGESLTEMEVPLSEIQRDLDSQKEEGNILMEFLAGDMKMREGNEPNTVRAIFNRQYQFMEGFYSELTSLKTNFAHITASNQDFHRQLSSIDSRISTIKARISFLEKLKLMTRIELARLQLEDDSFGQEIANVSDRIIEEVNANEAFMLELKQRLLNDLEKFEKMMQLNEENMEKMNQVIQNSREELKVIEDMISRGVQSLGQCMNSLIGEVQGIASNLEKGRHLPGLLQEIKTSITELESSLGQQKNSKLQKLELERWDGTSEDLQAVLNNLTTVLERRTASAVFEDVEMDVGDDSGELTLF